jgi:hypothetical protein
LVDGTPDIRGSASHRGAKGLAAALKAASIM